MGGDQLVVYFNGVPPADPVLDHPAVRARALGDGRARGLAWQQLLLPPAAAGDRLDVFFAPAYSCPLRLDVPKVTTLHDLSFFALPQDFGFLEGLRRRLSVEPSLRASRRVLVCADFTRREMVRLFPDLAERVIVVPHGADDDVAAAPARSEARRRRSLRGPYLLTVGTILNRRCAPELLRATALLKRRHPRLALDLVGENRTHPQIDLAALVRELALEGHVRLCGFVDDAGLAERYAAADVAVFLSEYEGFGLPALEAAGRGVPLVVGRAPALGEIFGEAALLVDPHDEAAIAAAVDRVLSEPALRERLVAAGRALAARHSWARTAALTRGALAGAARP